VSKVSFAGGLVSADQSKAFCMGKSERGGEGCEMGEKMSGDIKRCREGGSEDLNRGDRSMDPRSENCKRRKE